MCSLKSKSRSNAGSNRQREVSVYSTGPISSAQINKPKPCIAILDSIILWTRELWRFLGGNSISVFTSAMEQVVPKKIPSPQPNHNGRVKQHIARYYKAHDRLIGLAGLSQILYRSICPSGAGAERMRSFRHLPGLSYRHTPGRISAMLRYGFSLCLCLCLPDTLYRFNWSPFLHGKRTRRSNSRPRQIHLILALISAISTATHLKNYTFGDELLRSWAFELDLLFVLFQSSQFASVGMREWASPYLSQVCRCGEWDCAELP